MFETTLPILWGRGKLKKPPSPIKIVVSPIKFALSLIKIVVYLIDIKRVN